MADALNGGSSSQILDTKESVPKSNSIQSPDFLKKAESSKDELSSPIINKNRIDQVGKNVAKQSQDKSPNKQQFLTGAQNNPAKVGQNKKQ